MNTRRKIMRRALFVLLMLVGAWSVPSAAAVASTLRHNGVSGVRIALTTGGNPIKTGDHATVTATVTNATDHPVTGGTLLLGLVDLTPGQPVPLGLESWTSDSESVAQPSLAPGASASATWNLVMIQPGPLGLYASVMVGPQGPIESSPVTVLPVRDVRVLNPANVLPVALGEPALLIGLLVVIRATRARRAR